MSKNIDQVFTANPITSNTGTDLMYFGQSPYGAGDDAAMLYSNFSAQFAPTGSQITNVNQATSSAALSANHRYATNNGASLVTYTLPVSPTIGDTYIIIGGSSGGWTVAQNASQQIHLGSSATTAGVGGSISSSNQYDCVSVTNVAANTFTAYAVQGNLTVV